MKLLCKDTRTMEMFGYAGHGPLVLRQYWPDHLEPPQMEEHLESRLILRRRPHADRRFVSWETDVETRLNIPDAIEGKCRRISNGKGGKGNPESKGAAKRRARKGSTDPVRRGEGEVHPGSILRFSP